MGPNVTRRNAVCRAGGRVISSPHASPRRTCGSRSRIEQLSPAGRAGGRWPDLSAGLDARGAASRRGAHGGQTNRPRHTGARARSPGALWRALARPAAERRARRRHQHAARGEERLAIPARSTRGTRVPDRSDRGPRRGAPDLPRRFALSAACAASPARRGHRRRLDRIHHRCRFRAATHRVALHGLRELEPALFPGRKDRQGRAARRGARCAPGALRHGPRVPRARLAGGRRIFGHGAGDRGDPARERLCRIWNYA